MILIRLYFALSGASVRPCLSTPVIAGLERLFDLVEPGDCYLLLLCRSEAIIRSCQRSPVVGISSYLSRSGEMICPCQWSLVIVFARMLQVWGNCSTLS